MLTSMIIFYSKELSFNNLVLNKIGSKNKIYLLLCFIVAATIYLTGFFIGTSLVIKATSLFISILIILPLLINIRKNLKQFDRQSKFGSSDYIREERIDLIKAYLEKNNLLKKNKIEKARMLLKDELATSDQPYKYLKETLALTSTLLLIFLNKTIDFSIKNIEDSYVILWTMIEISIALIAIYFTFNTLLEAKKHLYPSKKQILEQFLSIMNDIELEIESKT